MGVLTQEDINRYKKAKNDFDTLSGQIDDRVDEIIKLIRKCFGVTTRFSWWFEGAEEGEAGIIKMYPHGIDFNIDPYSDKMQTWDADYANWIPLEFLTMTDEQIESEIKKDIKETKEREQAAKEKKIKAKTEREKKKKEVLNKLTKEEKKILGLK